MVRTRQGTARRGDGAPPDGRAGGDARSLRGWAALGFLGAAGLAVFGTRVGAVPDGAAWWFSAPHGNHVAFEVGFYLSVALLVVAWWGVGVRARAGALGTRAAWGLLAAWGAPLVLGPPLFSRDLYSYVAQGLIAHGGHNPYSASASVLGPGPVLESVASVWRHTPAPYGPLFVSATRAVAAVFGTSLTAEVIALRVLELAGVALMMAFLPRLARTLGADPGVALWLGVLSPLSLFSFVASGHNDAMMLGLLVAGLTLASERRPAVAMVLCALAVCVKLPAAAAIVFVGAGWLRSTGGRRRLRALATIVAVPVATVAAVTWASGLGWSWLGPTALRVPAEVRVLPTPSVALGSVVSEVLSWVGIHLQRHGTVTVTQWLCVTLSAFAVLWLVLHVRRVRDVRLLGCALAVFVVASPTVWPWYLLWGLALLAATPAQRSKALAVAAAFAMLVVGPGGTPLLQGAAAFAVVAACTAGAVWLVRGRRWAAVALGPVV